MIHKTAIIFNCIPRHDIYVGAYCVIGDPAENRATWPAIPFGVEIHKGAILTKLVTVDSGTVRNTIIGKRTMLMAHSHVGHDALIGDDVTIACGAKIGGFVEIGNGCNIGLNAVIHPRQKIPPYTMIGAGCVITKTAELKPFGVWVGNPGRFLKMNNAGIEKAELTREQVDEITKKWLDENQFLKTK